MNLPTPRAVIFDWDNTLVDTWPIIHEALHHTFAAMGHVPWTLEEVMLRVGKSARDAFPPLFGGEWEKAVALYQGHYRDIHLSHLKALPGAEEVLLRLRARGVAMALVSNKKGDTLRLEAAHLGWAHYFGAMVGSGDAAQDKPDATPALLALGQLGVAAEPEVWFVGDTEVDLACAQASGCTPILYGAQAAGRVEFTAKDYHGFPYARYVRGHEELLALTP